MRTTLDLPDELARRAKLAAVRRGMTLRRFVAGALENELGRRSRPAEGRPLRFPLIRSLRPASYDLDPARIKDILLREETAAYETALRR